MEGATEEWMDEQVRLTANPQTRSIVRVLQPVTTPKAAHTHPSIISYRTRCMNVANPPCLGGHPGDVGLGTCCAVWHART